MLSSVILASALGSATIQADELPRRVSFGARLRTQAEGLEVLDVVPGLSAEQAAVKSGDIVVRLGSTPVPTVPELITALKGYTDGMKTPVTVIRDGRQIELQMSLVEVPREETDEFTVRYGTVNSMGERMRTLLSVPKKPGPHKVLFYIQGLQYASVDAPIGGDGVYGQLLGPLAKDYAILRVDKPGTGDSEGGTNQTLTFWRESDIYVQALRWVKQQPGIDPSKIAIFGHSMGGVMGPIAAAQEPVAAIMPYGTAVEPWGDYLQRNSHRQAMLGGATEQQADANVENIKQYVEHCLDGPLTPGEMALKKPALKPYVDAVSPDGIIIDARSVHFHRQLHQAGMEDWWKRVGDAKVVAMYGEYDFVSFKDDHERIAQITGGEMVVIPTAGHGGEPRESFADAQARWGQFTEIAPGFHPAIRKVMESL